MKILLKIRPYFPVIILVFITIVYFYPFFYGFIPIPGDILLTTYFPWRDQFWIWNTNQLPFTTSNFWTFDAIRQSYPWQYIGIEILKSGQIPLWNPYAFAGTPLIANNQSAIFYPLNILYFLMDFPYAWGTLTILQPLLGSIFLFILLKEYKISNWFCLWGAILFSWGGFMASYLHTHVLGHTLIWLPLSIFALHKINEQFKLRWVILLLIALTCSLLAGYLQIGFYSLLLIFLYQIILFKRSIKHYIIIILLILASVLISSPQIIPTLEFNAQTYRDASWYSNSTIPPSHIARLVVPHMYGHVATQNWSSDINFKEFPYIGIIGLVFALIGIIKYYKIKIYLFWVITTSLIIILSIDSPITKSISTIFPIFHNFTPLRAFGFVDLSLAILSAKGFEFVWNNRNNTIILMKIASFFLILSLLFNFISFNILQIPHSSKSQALFIYITPIILILTIFLYFLKRIQILNFKVLFLVIFIVGILDILLSHALYARSFIHKNNLYPETKTINFLQNNLGDSRFLSIDPWTLPPNTFIPYHLNTITVYDSTLSKYSYQFYEEWRNHLSPNNQKYTRAIEPTSFSEQLLNILNIKFIISASKLNNSYLKEVTFLDNRYIYENINTTSDTLLTSDVFVSNSDHKTIELLFNSNHKNQIILDRAIPPVSPSNTQIALINRNTQEETWKVNTNTPQIFYRSVSFNPGWSAQIDNKRVEIIRANFGFQAVYVPEGEHIIKFSYSPPSFYIGLILSLSTLFFVISYTIIKSLSNRK